LKVNRFKKLTSKKLGSSDDVLVANQASKEHLSDHHSTHHGGSVHEIMPSDDDTANQLPLKKKIDQYRSEPITEYKMVRGKEVITTFRYDDDPELYKLARKRQQNKVSAQVSRTERAKLMEATEKSEAEVKEKLKRLEAECAENEREIAELTKPLEQPRDLFEYEDYAQLI
jgi:hypothetical protein